jgi:hypothetical protein
MNTPFFPAWRPRLNPLKPVLQKVRSQPLPAVQNLFACALPQELLLPQSHGCHSRERIFTLALTFWAFLAQILSPGTSCREIVRQVQSLFSLLGQNNIDEQTSAYCQARLRLPLRRLWQILGCTVRNLRRKAAKELFWLGHEVKVVDGSSCTLPDTAANQKAFPQQRMQKPGCGFPLMKFVGLFSLTTGALISVATGNIHEVELSLFRRIWHYLKAGDVLLADRHFCDYGTIAGLWRRGVDCVLRLHQARPRDFRKGLWLGPGDRLVTWTKPKQRQLTIPQKLWRILPQEITLRLIKVRCATKGFRTRELVLVTTLLDPEKYPASEIARLYLRRWEVELFFRDIKTMMRMEHLRCQSPPMIQREFLMHLIAYNLIRTVMWEAARRYEAPLDRISFKGAVDAVRQYGIALSRARTQKKAAALIRDLLVTLAEDLVPHRPGRQEPRALKRRPKPFSLLTKPRHVFKEIPHRGKYCKCARSQS